MTPHRDPAWHKFMGSHPGRMLTASSALSKPSSPSRLPQTDVANAGDEMDAEVYS